MAMRWSARRSDLVALGVSGALAAAAPLHVFLLAYIVLGPFHYLTEVAWLRRKDFYFSDGALPGWAYGALSAGLALAGAADFILRRGVGYWMNGGLLLLSLSVWVRNRYVLLAIAAAGIVVKVLSPGAVLFVGVILPTLVHVFFFTWIFMMSGALRAGADGGRRWVNPVLMLGIPLALLVAPLHYHAPGALWQRMEAVSFGGLHHTVAGFLHRAVPLAGPAGDLTADPVFAGVLRVFAFAYLFHYLNWFGKTELLGWHRIPARTWSVIGVLYAVSVGLYLWNFTVGFLVANFLSLLHVLMEFPLDWRALRFVTLGWTERRTTVSLERAEPAR